MTIRFDLRGRRAIVTGGARGIGRATAELFLKSGGAVAVWDVDPVAGQAAVDALGSLGKTIFVAVDQASLADVEAAAARTRAAFGGVDILVNNAGVAGPNAPVTEYDPVEWARIININLVGVYHCCRAVTPMLLENDWGRIVNVASVAGKEGNPSASAYSASKAGVIALTKSLGKELASTKVTVNCLTPAAVRTDIFDQMSEEHIGYMLSKIPMGRFGTVEENAAMIAWMCSREASFTTAAVFDTSGGRSTY